MLTKNCVVLLCFINLSAMLHYLAFAAVQTYDWVMCLRHSRFDSFCREFHRHCLKCRLVSSPKVGFPVVMISNRKAIQKPVLKRLLKLQKKDILKREKLFSCFFCYSSHFPALYQIEDMVFKCWLASNYVCWKTMYEYVWMTKLCNWKKEKEHMKLYFF